MMKAETVALRDQIIAVLRDAEVPLSTDQVAGKVGRTHPSRPDGFDAGQVVYRNLRALEHQGRCERIVRDPYDRRVFWVITVHSVLETVDLSAHDREFRGGE
jgi:hypothetical protein